MADFKKAFGHHAKAGVAMKSGDAKTAMHHVGHMMAALKHSPADTQNDSQEPTVPPVSQAQRGAMYAAAEGKSTLGIPPKVGAEFVQDDPGGKLPEKSPVANLKKRLKGMKK